MALLLDTNVVSELRRAVPDPNVLAWHRRNASAEAFLSALTIGEIRQGIERLAPTDDRRHPLERWLDDLLISFASKILPVTVAVAQEWGRFSAHGRRPPVVDGLIAATAKAHGLTLVTRNVRDVAMTAVPVVNPFDPG